MTEPFTVLIWRFNTRYQKEWTKPITNKQILYKCIKVNTSAMWQHTTKLKYSSPNRFKKQKQKKTRATQKRVYFVN